MEVHRSDLVAARPPHGSGHVPVRTCVGCRGRAAAAELLRVVAVDGVLVPDRRRRLPGRGAWLHLDADCLAKALKRRAFPRALRLAGPLDAEELEAAVQDPARDVPGPVSEDRKQVDPS